MRDFKCIHLGLTKFNRRHSKGACFYLMLNISQLHRKMIGFADWVLKGRVKNFRKKFAREKFVIILHPILTTEYYLFYYLNYTRKMKKLVLALAVIASVSMISCTNTNTEATAEEAVDTTAVVEEAPVDTTVVADSAAVVDSAATEAAPEAAPAE